ncbi:GntR family transcriptional regulator [Sabulicella rubraurantiaca]|uniref:GntR family transcriptional regulator n=1 Tax=Sabulicella rubraurantiaca TaxID=2811429 RepID=UPI001A961DC8|nr:GntR family transcriptional regulator [Sabulicella rubraurantiaca]
MNYIVNDVQEAIRSGRLALGQRLIEADLARELGVSRGSLREALNRLSTAGLVEIVPNRGAVVRRLSRKEVADRYQIRARLEGLAAALAAERLHEADHRDRLLSAAPPASSGAPSVEEYRRDNYRLHETIADLSGNPQLAALIRQLWLPAHMVELRGSLDTGFHRESAEDHRRIVDAILAQDPTAADAAMRTHLEARCQVILSLPSRVFGE